MKYEFYEKQVKLLLKTLPIVASEKVFALKGGTAINFFIRDLPRLSVDIDLTYLNIESREETILNINTALSKISNRLISIGLKVSEKTSKGGLKKLEVSDIENISIKIEPNYLLRGNILPIERMRVVKSVSDKFEMSASMNILNINELYAGKICAGLDRQHPRDLFDIKLLLENEGLNRNLVQTFLVYLISHNRPINEMLNPNFLDIKDTFEKEFIGMTMIPVSLEDLIETRKNLVNNIKKSLTDKDKNFLLSFKKGDPDWNLIDFSGIDKLPAVVWKMQNINKMTKEKHKEQFEKLHNLLSE